MRFGARYTTPRGPPATPASRHFLAILPGVAKRCMRDERQKLFISPAAPGSGCIGPAV